MIEVAAGVIIRDGRILLQQRPESKDYPMTWECPGGKVEGNESHHQAIERELEEELGLIVKGIREWTVWSGDVQRELDSGASGKVFLVMYPVIRWFRSPEPREGQGFGWFTINEMRNLSRTPGNRLAELNLVSHMRANGGGKWL